MSLNVDDFMGSNFEQLLNIVHTWLEDQHSDLFIVAIQHYKSNRNIMALLSLAAVTRQIMEDNIEYLAPKAFIRETLWFNPTSSPPDNQPPPTRTNQFTYLYQGPFLESHLRTEGFDRLTDELDISRKMFSSLNKYVHVRRPILSMSASDIEDEAIRIIRGLGRFLSLVSICRYRIVATFDEVIAHDAQTICIKYLEVKGLSDFCPFTRSFSTQYRHENRSIIIDCDGLILPTANSIHKNIKDYIWHKYYAEYKVEFMLNKSIEISCISFSVSLWGKKPEFFKSNFLKFAFNLNEL